MTESILPPNATAHERALEQAIAARFLIPLLHRAVWSAADCPVNFLPWLAWGLSIDDWGPEWPEALKRARIASAIPIQRRKGTAQSVRDVVAAFGGSIAVREWWQTTPRGEPHTFDLIMSGGNADTIDAVVAGINRTKPVRSRFTFTQALEFSGAVGVVAGFRPVTFLRLNGLSTPI